MCFKINRKWFIRKRGLFAGSFGFENTQNYLKEKTLLNVRKIVGFKEKLIEQILSDHFQFNVCMIKCINIRIYVISKCVMLQNLERISGLSQLIFAIRWPNSNWTFVFDQISVNRLCWLVKLSKFHFMFPFRIPPESCWWHFKDCTHFGDCI